jgi:hypothetical protein
MISNGVIYVSPGLDVFYWRDPNPSDTRLPLWRRGDRTSPFPHKANIQSYSEALSLIQHVIYYGNTPFHIDPHELVRVFPGLRSCELEPLSIHPGTLKKWQRICLDPDCQEPGFLLCAGPKQCQKSDCTVYLHPDTLEVYEPASAIKIHLMDYDNYIRNRCRKRLARMPCLEVKLFIHRAIGGKDLASDR